MSHDLNELTHLRVNTKIKKNSKIFDDIDITNEEIHLSPEIDETDESIQFLTDIGINDVNQGDISENKTYDEISTLLTKRQKNTLNKKLTTLRSKRSTRTDVRGYFGPTDDNIPPPDYCSSDEEEKLLKDDNKLTDEDLEKRRKTQHIGKLPDDVTYVHGLSPKVLSDLRVIARLELDDLFERHAIKWVRYKPKRGKDSGIFGVSLTNLLNHDLKKEPTLRVPFFYLRLLEKLKENLNEEGILRISGSVVRMREMRTELDNHSVSQMESILKEALPADLAGLLKQFLKELPSALLTHKYMDAYPNVLKITDVNDMIYGFQLLNLLLPDEHLSSFHLLMRLLHGVINNSQNKMSLENVATLMGPNLFVSVQAKGFAFDSFGLAVQTLHQMLKLDPYLWIVPPKLISQIRRKYDKKLKARPKSTVVNEVTPQNWQFLTINIEFQSQRQISKCIDMQTTVYVVLKSISGEKFLTAEEKSNLRNLRLFEYGGNIYCRLLSKSTNIHSVLNANPTAAFFASFYTTNELISYWPKHFSPLKL